MKFNWKNKYICAGLTAFGVVAASICFYYLIFHVSSLATGIKKVMEIFMPIVFGLVTAYLLTPVLNKIEYAILIPLFDKMKIKNTKKRNQLIRIISITITVLIFFLLIYGLIAMLLSQIIPSIQSIVSNFDTYINNFTKWLNQLLSDNPSIKEYSLLLVDRYSVELENLLNNTILTQSSAITLIRTVSLSVINIITFLWDFIIGFVISIYVLASKENFAGQAKKIAYALFSKNSANQLIKSFRFTHKTFAGFISGKIIDSIIIGILCFICTSFMNIPYVALVSLIIGLTNVIPFFGPFLGAIPTTILIFVVDPTNPLKCVYFLIFIFILQQFDGNVLGPKILGESTGITGFWVIFSITIFGGLFGILGMIVGVPIFAIIYSGIKALTNTTLKRKDMPEETKLYLDVEKIDEEGTFYKYTPDYKKRREVRSPKKDNKNKEEK